MTSSSRLRQLLARERVDRGDPLDLVAEQLDSHRVLLVCRVDLDGVAPHPELAPDEVGIVALVLHLDQPAQDGPLVLLGPPYQVQDPLGVLLGRSQAVDAAHRGHHDGVPAGEQGRRGGVAEPVDLVVDRAVLLDVGVARRQIRLRLVVVVVADEVLHPVVGEERPHLVGQLGRQRLVGGDDERRLLDFLDGPGHGGALAATGDAEKGLEPVPAPDTLRQPGYRLRLVAGRVVFGDHLEIRHGSDGTGGL